MTMASPNQQDRNINETMSDPQHWTLMIDFAPGEDHQRWSLTQPTKVLNGEGGLGENAGRICTVAAGEGAVTVN